MSRRCHAFTCATRSAILATCLSSGVAHSAQDPVLLFDFVTNLDNPSCYRLIFDKSLSCTLKAAMDSGNFTKLLQILKDRSNQRMFGDDATRYIPPGGVRTKGAKLTVFVFLPRTLDATIANQEVPRSSLVSHEFTIILKANYAKLAAPAVEYKIATQDFTLDQEMANVTFTVTSKLGTASTSEPPAPKRPEFSQAVSNATITVTTQAIPEGNPGGPAPAVTFKQDVANATINITETPIVKADAPKPSPVAGANDGSVESQKASCTLVTGDQQWWSGFLSADIPANTVTYSGGGVTPSTLPKKAQLAFNLQPLGDSMDDGPNYTYPYSLIVVKASAEFSDKPFELFSVGVGLRFPNVSHFFSFLNGIVISRNIAWAEGTHPINGGGTTNSYSRNWIWMVGYDVLKVKNWFN